MAPKFVPRLRKHKVLARQKDEAGSAQPEQGDSNVLEYIPPAKADIEARKAAIRAELKVEGQKISGKKAKRLEKYIETKLKKDENRELMRKLAEKKTDTSLFASSKALGSGRETKRERLGRAMREKQAGIDVDNENDQILFEEHTVRETPEPESEDERPVLKSTTTIAASQPSEKQEESKPAPVAPSVGFGLKRPLATDETGRPAIPKKQKRGGISTKFQFHSEQKAAALPKPTAEPAWEGFDSDEDSEEDEDELDENDSAAESGDSEQSDDEEAVSEEEEESDEEEEASESDSEESSEDNDPEAKAEAKKQRSSAFKSWATQQRNEAMGFQPSSNIELATETKKIEGFKPRPLESDPLPAELQVTNSKPRKAFAVTFERPAEIQEARLQLPVVGEEQKIMEAVHNNNTVVIYGATGSGKTTQVPQFLYESGYGAPDGPTPGMIGVTQPRRVAAVSMAKRVADELGDHGDRVAYQIRFEGTVSPKTAIKFMTDGVLLREVAQDIALRKYSAIVIDEAHERSVNTDILVGMLSRVVKLRDEMAAEDPTVPPLKLIIMSATLRVTDFTENMTLFLTPPPVVQAEGRQYTVTNHFARVTHHDYVEELFKKISKGHKKLPPGGFLVFLTGQGEIAQLSKRLKEAFRIGSTASGPQVRISAKDAPIEAEDIDFGNDQAEEDLDVGFDSDDDERLKEENDDKDFEIEEDQEAGPTKMHVLPLYSLLPTREQLRVFEPTPDNSRLVILATNVAETSLTIPGIRYVFDCGRSKERKYDEKTGVQSFEIGWISKASANQRAGRAGRTGPGHCYRMYSSAVYERDFPQFAEPEILRMPIEGVVLQLKAMNLQHVVNFPFPTPPDRASLAASEKLLTYLQALSPTGQITKLGGTMSIFPLSPRFARILLIGHLHDCLPYTIALVAGLSAPDIYIPENQVIPAATPKEEGEPFTQEDRLEEDARTAIRRRFNAVHHAFCSLDDRSDAIKLLQVVGEFAHDPTEAWCVKHFVRFKVLKEIAQLRRQITDLLRANIPAFANLKFEDKLPPPSQKQVQALKQMVAAGFIDHIAIRADLAPVPPELTRKPTRAIEVQYLTLFPSADRFDEEEQAVYIHPSSPLAHVAPKECPEYIVYSYLQRASPNAATPERRPRARMHALTDISGSQIAALAKGTPLLQYGKPIKEGKTLDKMGLEREAWVIPYLRRDGGNEIGWPLPVKKVVQKKIPGKGWVVEG
jgi:ATP-dependent RNA helicase DHX37/DHR1